MGVRRWFAGLSVLLVACVLSQEREPKGSSAPSATAPPPVASAPPSASPTSSSSASTDSTAGGSTAIGSSPIDAAVSDVADAAPSACPDAMVLVDGNYCPRVAQTCKHWVDPPTNPYWNYRCAEYAEPASCVSPSREHKRFCIDKEEYVAPGEALPLNHQSWTSASKVCASRGARLCLESEWQFACEGEEMRPYPYGFTRDPSACNIDRMHLGKPGAGLADLRASIDEYPQCVSPFGVHDMSGNIEEWATLDHGAPPDRSTMKGAWWLPGKNTCRAATLGHGETYEGPQVGVRCCKDAEP